MRKLDYKKFKQLTMALLLFICGQIVNYASCSSYGSEEEYRDNNEDNVREEQLEDIREDVIINSIPEKDLPKFGEPLQNVTVPVGREAVLQCVVENLQTYKIAWLRVDTQTVLTIQHHVITKNHRMSITHAEKRAWILRIRDVKESDKGWYMCQINTDPMKSQVGYLNVVVPPDILDDSTSTDMVVREGGNVTLHCAATGSPPPTITWRREGGEPISLHGESKDVISYDGSTLNISRVSRLNMGAYLCIASNGIPPSVSKRVMLKVHFPPMITIPNQLVGAAIGQTIILECQSEAFPKSINYWMKNDTIIVPGERFQPDLIDKIYKVTMRLTIKDVRFSDFGTYKCLAKNSLGETDGAIKLYHIPQKTTTTTTSTTTVAMDKIKVILEKLPNRKEINNRSQRMRLTDSHNSTTKNNIYATSSHWNLQDAIRDKNPDNNNHRSDYHPSKNSIQREADSLTENQNKSTSSDLVKIDTGQFIIINLLTTLGTLYFEINYHLLL
ncbi:lachesin isoform X2 [Condylostylus longicornis]|uniref:lachesin isoform X2 n=1 Tax=Condylostylus longicornis TaxID=2530218 RepID=UPI00244DEB34|nr:lachesin isoform X2 [Condylostylus longicornis]